MNIKVSVVMPVYNVQRFVKVPLSQYSIKVTTILN